MNKNSREYAVLTCDIIRSRRFDARELSSALHSVLDETNRRFADSLHRKFEIMLGDSFQCVLSAPRLFFDIFQHIEEALWLAGAVEFGAKEPVLLRCGVGFGRISNPDAPLGAMSGEAFLLARSAIDSIKKTHRRSGIAVDTTDIRTGALLAASARLSCAIKSRWTIKQRKALKLYRKNHSITETARLTGTTKQNIEKMFSTMKLWEILDFEEAMRKFSI